MDRSDRDRGPADGSQGQVGADRLPRPQFERRNSPEAISGSSFPGAAVVAQRESPRLVTERTWVRMLPGAGFFLFSIISVVCL